MNVGLLTRISRSSRSREGGGSACSLDDGRPSLPREIFEIFDLKLFFFFAALLSNVLLALLALLKLSSDLNVSVSTTLVRDLFIKSSANETFGLGSRLFEARELIDDRRFEFCLEIGMWFEFTSRLELVGGLMPVDGTRGFCKLSRVGLG